MIRDLGPENVVVKGGHLENIAADVLYDGRKFSEFRAERIDTKNTHGTGCIFASAIAANLAHKKTVRESVPLRSSSQRPSVRASRLGRATGPPIRWPPCITGQDWTLRVVKHLTGYRDQAHCKPVHTAVG